MPFSLYLLALAVFAMGTSEFMLVGLLPAIAREVGVGVGTAGLLTSAFAAGMVVGAPLLAAASRRWPSRRGLTVCLAAFAAAHIVAALAPSFGLLLATRVVAALANAGFLALALGVVARLVEPGRQARGLAVLLSGTTAAIVAGVPGGALIGDLLGWRVTFWVVAGLCAPAAFAVWRLGPALGGGGPVPALRRELALLRDPRLRRVMAVAATANAATFGGFTFLAPVVTGTAGLGRAWVAVALVLFGLGSWVGVSVAGRHADRHAGRLVRLTGPALAAAWAALALLAGRPVALLALLPVLGALAFAFGSTLIAGVLRAADAAPTMAGAYATGALNAGAVLGPVAAGLTLGAGDVGPLWLSALLVASAAAAARRTATG